MDPVMKAMLESYVKSITFESNINEPIRIDKPFAPKPPGLADKAMEAIKPKFTIELFDEKPIVIAPAGEPEASTRGQIKVGAVVGGVALAGLVLYGLANKKR